MIFDWNELPRVASGLRGIGGVIRAEPSDFQVTEIPAYLPDGSGSHAYFLVRKVGKTTRDLVVALTGAGIPENRIGVAGLKDKWAITQQWISVPWAMHESAERLADLPGVDILERSRHRNKLGIGHLRGNAFDIMVRNARVDAAQQARLVLDHLARVGVPNYFGPQRFGRGGRNAEEGVKVLLDPPRGGDRRLQRFLVSSVQSLVFNRLLARRIEAGAYDAVWVGEWAKRFDSGGEFRVTDPSDADRARRLEITSLLPLFGRKVGHSDGEAAHAEVQVLASLGLDARRFGSRRGARRPSRHRLEGADVTVEDHGVRLSFVLPKGAYATSVLREVMDVDVDVHSDVQESDTSDDD